MSLIKGDSPLEVLSKLEDEINPAIILAEELMQKGLNDGFDFEDSERAQATLRKSRQEIEKCERQLAAMIKSPATPAPRIPKGF